jgi:receptor expression-enhancing protein 5/6
LYRAYPRIRIPFYYAFKLAFLVYLGYPGWNGATLIYNNFLKGVLQKYESTVDAHLDAAKASAAAAVANASQSSGETDIKKKN